MTARFLDLFDTDTRNQAIKQVDYYDGRSKKYLAQYLNNYRRNALSKGMQPITLNVTKEIVDKSGMLFSGRPPVLQVYPLGATNTDIDETATLQLQGVLETAQWIEHFTNLDPLVRQLKTVLVLIQYDAETKELFFTPLSQANCAVNLVNRQIETLIYFTGQREQIATYRIWTAKLVQDLEVTSGGSETIVSTEPNPFGQIPVVAFHDTNLPRDGFWNPMPEDLVTINDVVNRHMTDGAYAISHAELQTLFTNAQIQGSAIAGSSVVEDYGSKLGPRWVTSNGGEGFVGGPGEAVAVETLGSEAVFLEYKGPSPDIEPLDKVIRGWFRDYARAWSVTIEDQTTGSGTADSGFKLMVKEIPNAELRKKRQRMMEAGFKRLYEVLLVINEKFDLGLTPNTELFLQFSEPELPVDEKSTEEVWSIKINEGRASLVTYFMTQEGLTRQGAEEMVKQLAADRALEATASGGATT